MIGMTMPGSDNALEQIMPSDALETLRQVNGNLRSALSHLRPERKHCSAIKPQDLSGILSHLLRAAECLRRLPPPSPANSPANSEDALAFGKDALQKEALEYRSNLQNLKHFLPDVHGRLLAERSRLETARTHLAAATAWAKARQKTL